MDHHVEPLGSEHRDLVVLKIAALVYADGEPAPVTQRDGLREVAKVLGVPERKFIKQLEDDGVLFRQSGQLLPSAEHHHAGRFEVKTGEANGHTYVQPRFTPEGIAWIANAPG
jgi:phage antirepressor YoqD-like protein